MSKGGQILRGFMVVPATFQFFPRGCRPDSVFSEDWRVFTIEGITNLPKMKQRSDRKGFHFLNHKRAKKVTTFGILFVQKSLLRTDTRILYKIVLLGRSIPMSEHNCIVGT